MMVVVDVAWGENLTKGLWEIWREIVLWRVIGVQQ